MSPDSALLIVNALFFSGSWTESFDEGKPQLFTYYNGNGDPVLVPMMTRYSKKQVVAHFTTDLVNGRDDKCTALAIPYEVL